MATVLLCRHGETPWNRDRRVQGWAPTGLTERGREQAAALGEHLASSHAVDRLVSSDLERAVETARLVGRPLDVEASFDPAWRERDFGRFQGLTYEELFEGYPEYAVAESGYAAVEARPESGERLLEVRERALHAFAALCEDLGPDETAAVVTHGGPLYLVVGAVKGLDAVASLTGRQHNCAANEVRVGEGDPELIVENDVGFLSEATVQESD